MGGSSRSTEPSAFESRPGGTVPKSLVSAQVVALLIVEHQVEAFLFRRRIEELENYSFDFSQISGRLLEQLSGEMLLFVSDSMPISILVRSIHKNSTRE